MPTDPSDLPRVSPQDAKQALAANDPTVAVLDVRGAEEVADGSIAGRAHLESAAFDDAAAIDALLDGPLKGKEKVFVHCQHSQKRGPACAAKLADRIKERREAGGGGGGEGGGPDVVVLAGGFHQFSQLAGAEELVVTGLAATSKE